MIAATVLAALLRFTALSEMPPQAWTDETWVAGRAYDLLSGGQLVAHYGLKARGGGGDAGLPWLAVLPMLMGIQSIVTSRVVTAAAGTVAVPMAYACFRELASGEFFKRRRVIGVLAAGGLSYLLSQVILSRVGMEAGSMPVMYLFCVWQVQRGLNRGAWSGWALAGLVGGTMQYLGPHARFILPVMAFMIIHGYLIAAPPGRQAIVRGTALLTVIGVAACGWLVATFIQNPKLLYGRGVTVTEGVLHGGDLPPVVAVSLNLLKMIGAFVLIGDGSVRHNLPYAPLFDPVMSIGFVAGVIWMIGSLHRSALARTMLAWLILLMVTSVLTIGAPNYERSAGMAGASVGLMALGWAMLPDRLEGWLVRMGIGRSPLIIGVLAALSLVWNITDFVVEWPKSPDMAEEFTTEAATALYTLAERSASEPVFVDVIRGGKDVMPVHFAFRNSDAIRVSLQDCLPLVDGAPTRASYVVNPYEDVGAAQTIREAYTDTRTVYENLALWEDGFITQIDIPAGTLIKTPAFQPTLQFANGLSLYGFDWSGADVQRGGSIDMVVYWQVNERLADDVTSFFHIHAAGVRDVAPLAQYDGQPCNGTYFPREWQPGMVIKDWVSIPLPADLPPGSYEVLAGWYNTATQERIKVAALDASAEGDRAVIGEFVVGGP